MQVIDNKSMHKFMIVPIAETTYIFFGKRGSGKTTIRMQARLNILTAAYQYIALAARVRSFSKK